MLPHTALRTARPSWQPAAPAPVSEPGRRAVARQRGPGRPWGRLRGGADRRARPYADPVGLSRVRGSGGPQPRTPCTGRAARRAGPSRARGCIRSHRARTGRARGADTGRTWSRRRHVGGAGGSRRRGRVRGSVTPVGPAGASDRRARELHVGGAGARGRVSSRASHARGAVRNRTASRAVHRRSPGAPRALAGRAGAGRMCLWHARGRPLPVGSGRPRGASGSCALGGVPGG